MTASPWQSPPDRDYALRLCAAIDAPRVVSHSLPSSFECFPRAARGGGALRRRRAAELARRSHEVEQWPDWTSLTRSLEAVRADPVTGLVSAAAYPAGPRTRLQRNGFGSTKHALPVVAHGLANWMVAPQRPTS